ncbi:MAG: S8 family serine peptidase [Acidobacteria bacterium]|nr:S8 family serine peptidase [Acidobacteriota bacterium]
MPPTIGHSRGILSPQTTSPLRFVPGEVLIQFRSSASETDKSFARSLVSAVRKERLRADIGSGELELASIPDSLSVDTVIRYLQSNQAVRFVEPNWIYTHHATSNDPQYTNGNLWGMYGDMTSPVNQFGSQAGEAWERNNHTGSNTVYVGVIDEGIDLNHPDLRDNIWTNPFDTADGMDNDGNGFVDDLHGWDFFQNNNTIYDGSPGDNNTDSHGTHVSGTIGGKGGNGQGVAGVNWNVTIISGKFLGPEGGTAANAVRAVNYFTDLKTRHGLNIVATNNSWGGGGYSQSLHDAIIRGAKAGILFCAAAGNGIFGIFANNNDNSPSYPANYNTSVGTSTETAASYDAVISITALASNGTKPSWANIGATTVDLGAPGVGVISTTPNNTYSSFSGTSMATPHVTGAAALYKSVFTDASAITIKNAILDSARNTLTSSMDNITLTEGRLNIGRFFEAPVSAPAAPSTLTATAASSSQINLSWTDNSNNEDGFRIERCQGSGCTTFAEIAQVGANVTSYQNTGLAANTAHSYRVRAFNGGGNSGYSNTATATTQAAGQLPSAPSTLSATAASSSQINLGWTDNSNNEDGFRIERCQGSGCTNFAEIAQVGANVTSYQNTGLAAGTTYSYRVRAFNGGGNSGYSNTATATTQAAGQLPAAPSNLSATAVSNSQVNLSWTDNSNNESGFKIERCQGLNCTNFAEIGQVGANVTSFSNTGLSRIGFYSYRVRAFNSAGNSGYSNTASTVTPF